jgi:hypothetical protein
MIKTLSLCPVCYKKIEAEIIFTGGIPAPIISPSKSAALPPPATLAQATLARENCTPTAITSISGHLATTVYSSVPTMPRL